MGVSGSVTIGATQPNKLVPELIGKIDKLARKMRVVGCGGNINLKQRQFCSEQSVKLQNGTTH